MSAPNLFSQIQLARLLDVRPATIRAWEAAGCPVASKSSKSGEASLYALPDVWRWREEQVTRAATGDLAAMDMEELRRRKLTVEVTLGELTLAQRQGQLVAVSEVEREVSAMLSALRGRLLGIGAKVAPMLDLAADTASRKEVIDDEVHDALTEISGNPMQFLGPEPDAEASD